MNVNHRRPLAAAAPGLMALALLCFAPAESVQSLQAAQPVRPERPETRAPGGAAQSPAGVPTPRPPDAPAAKVITARALTRIALADLKFSRQPGPDEYAVAAALLDLAHQLDGGDQDILRLLIEAVSQAGDRDRVADLTRQLLKLDPADTVAQLGLISSNIARLQDVDARLKAYEQFLGAKGDALDASVRSRLALDCALLLRERGDAGGFAERLRQAVTLDATNREAAALLLTYVSQRGDAVDRRFEALLLLLAAEPLDPQAHLEVARELASVGASRQALRFYSNHEEIMKGFGAQLSAEAAVEKRIEQWRLDGPSKVVSELSEGVLKPRKALEQQIAAAKAEGRKEDLAKLPSPDDIKLYPEMEEVWLLAASAAGDQAGMLVALGEMQGTQLLVEAAARNAASPPPPPAAPASRPGAAPPAVDEEAVKAAELELFRTRLALAWSRLLVGMQVEQAERTIQELRADPRLAPGVRDRLESWLALRKGELASAGTGLEAHAATDPLARLGLGVLAEQRGDRAAAAESYIAVARALSGSTVGAWAYTRAAVVLERAPAPSPEAATLAAMADGVPRLIDDMCRSPRFQAASAGGTPEALIGARAYEALLCSLGIDRAGPFEKARINITLRNLAPIPLGVGPDRAINSRFLLSPTIEIGPRRVGSTSPEIISLERRLRLMPREDITVSVWAEPGYNGLLQEMSAGETSRSRWRVMQGFRMNDKGQTEAGPYGLATETGLFVRLAFPRTEDSPVELAGALADVGDEQLPQLLGVIRWRLFRDEGEVDRLRPEDKQRLAAALRDRYLASRPEGRLLILAMMPPAQFIQALLSFDAAIIDAAETDPRVTLVKTITRSADKDSPLLAGASSSSNASVRAAGEAMRRRLESNPRTYSRFSLVNQP